MTGEGKYDPKQASTVPIRMHPNTMPNGQAVAEYIADLERQVAELKSIVFAGCEVSGDREWIAGYVAHWNDMREQAKQLGLIQETPNA